VKPTAKEKQMVEEKPWYLSKTIWGSLVSIAAAFTGIAGITLDPASQAGITEAIVQMISAAGAIIAIHGRLTATEVITRS
jgi:hypothetical protein